MNWFFKKTIMSNLISFVASFKFSMDKAIKLLIILLMCYQLIDLTLEYREYKTIIKSELKHFESSDLPSITLCRKDHDWKYERRYKMNGRFGYDILYSFQYIDQK